MEKFYPYFAAAGILAATIVLSWLFNRFMKRIIKKAAEDKDHSTNYQFLRHAITGLIYILGIGLAIYYIPGLRAVAQSMLAGAGIAAVAIGFASQTALSNIVAGIFIVIFKPFRVNDRLSIRDTISGVVEDINLRHTVIRNFENRRVIIPNSMISSEVIVNSDLIETKVCRWLEVGISYDSNIDLAKAIMADEAHKHPLTLDNRNDEAREKGDPVVPVRVLALGESGITLRAWIWANDTADAFALQCDLLESIKKRFDAEGIEIPFPHRTLVFKNQIPVS
ncbi:MAG: mechanosensitive ion channel family protein [Bacteroidota bacterium]